MALAAQSCIETRTTGSDTLCGGGCRGNGLTPAPAQPAVSTATTGGSVAANTYYVLVVYGNGVGEGPSSAEKSIVTTGATSTITVTSPAASTYATTYSVYASTTSGGPYFVQTTGVAIGTNYTRTTTPATSGAQPVGVDYSQADSAILSPTDLATTGVTTTLTSVSFVFTVAMVGNWIQITGGTNFTVGFYEILSYINATTIVLDRAPTTGVGAIGTGYVGGALASPGKAAGAKVAGNDVYIKSGTYTVTTSSSNVAGGIVNENTGGVGTTNVSRWSGFQTTRGDSAARPTLSAGATTSVTLFAVAASYVAVVNIALDGNAQTSTTGISNANTYVHLIQVKVSNTKLNGFNINSDRTNIDRCEATGCSGTAGFNTSSGVFMSFCEAYGNTVPGFILSYDTVPFCCTSSGNTGASSDGFQLGSVGGRFIGCLAYGNGRHGFNLQGNGALMSSLADCVFEGNAGWGVSTNQMSEGVWLLNCAGYNNTSGNYDSTQILVQNVSGFQALSASPFTNAAGGDFSLNSTAGGGALLRAAGYPGLMPRGLTRGYLDIGVAQHQDAGLPQRIQQVASSGHYEY